jgi:hypothetical protein
VLLASRGGASFALHGDYTHEPWFEEYDYDIGNATAAATQTDGVWRRSFERGLVLVNPNTTTKTVELGAPHSGSGHTSITRTDMRPHTGLILTRDDSDPLRLALQPGSQPGPAPPFSFGVPRLDLAPGAR